MARLFVRAVVGRSRDSSQQRYGWRSCEERRIQRPQRHQGSKRRQISASQREVSRRRAGKIRSAEGQKRKVTKLTQQSTTLRSNNREVFDARSARLQKMKMET